MTKGIKELMEDKIYGVEDGIECYCIWITHKICPWTIRDLHKMRDSNLETRTCPLCLKGQLIMELHKISHELEHIY